MLIWNQMNKILESSGAETLADTASQLMYNPRLDLAIVRDVTDSEFCYRMRASEDYYKFLAEAIPEIKEVTDAIKDAWSCIGYKDSTISDIPILEKSITPKTGSTHIDKPRHHNGEFRFIGGISLILSSGNKDTAYTDFYAKKLYGRDCSDRQGNVSQSKYSKLVRKATKLTDLETNTRQYPGDIIIISQLPQPTVHKSIRQPGRTVEILDYLIETNNF